MPHPAECQPIIDLIANLRAQEKSKLDVLKTLTGAEKWTAMHELGTLRTQIAQQLGLLAECENQEVADVTTQINIIDLPGVSGMQRLGKLWQLLPPAGQTVVQTAAVQNSLVTFAGVPLDATRQLFGITIEEVNNPSVNGPDFRSGPLPMVLDPEAGEPKQIEIVIFDTLVFDMGTLGQAVPLLPMQLGFSGPQGPVSITVENMGFMNTAGVLSLFASGAVHADKDSTFTFEHKFRIVPTLSMFSSELVETPFEFPPKVKVPKLSQQVAQAVAEFLTGTFLPEAAILNKFIAAQVNMTLGLPMLPSGSVLSVRELTVDGQSVTVRPAIGALGTILSDFQPS